MNAVLTSQSIRCILFDIDGTLVNSLEFAYAATNEVLIAEGFLPVSVDDYKIGCLYTTPRRLAWHATRDPNAIIGIQLGLKFDALYISRVTCLDPPIYNEITVALEVLRAKRPDLLLGAVTNASGKYGRAVIAAHADTSFRQFTLALGADDVAAPKPAADGLLSAARTLGVCPTQCIYVGDAVGDGLAATAAGMISIGVAWGGVTTSINNTTSTTPPPHTSTSTDILTLQRADHLQWSQNFTAIATNAAEFLALLLLQS
jgi:beta-phosphoglucomutase-like phosphatase (HAD superfamily)